MEEQSPIAFTDLEIGDELLLMGEPEGDLETIAVVLRAHESELVVHWVNLEESTAGQASILGMHCNRDRNEPFGQRFVAGVLHVAQGNYLLYLNNAEKAGVEPLSYVQIRRRGTVVYEAGTKPEGQGALPRLSSS